MNFEHCNYLGELELKVKNTPGCRLYELPDGQWVPSITSVTSFYNRQVFIEWRKSCLLYTSPSPRDKRQSRMPSSA